MRDPRQIWNLVTHLGLGWVGYRLCYALRRRLGGLRRSSPVVAWNDLKAPLLALASPPTPELGAWPGADCLAEAEEILRGRFRLFSDRTVEAGFPPVWQRNQLTREVAPADRHWSELGDFAFGDIKGIWELNRFGWAFVLVRAHARTGEARFAEAFWALFTDWCERNPPNLGPNWMCGQEATFRLMAVTFAAEHLGVPACHRDALARFVLATGRRIAANLGYALSQDNNHGISECVGLLTAALVLAPTPETTRWRRRAETALRDQLRRLVYPDGAFSQHSLVYHRVLLHDLGWAAHRLRLAGHATPSWLEESARRAHDFLRILVDAKTGEAPLFGTNDGANVLPLSEADFLDFRPVLQATAAAFGWPLPFPAGPWDEAATWFGAAPDAPRRFLDTPDAWHAETGGYLQLHAGGDRLFMRCPTRFRHRPAQADMLHVDLWLGGRAVTRDGGSFSYNSTERFASLAAAAHHNVLTVDGIEPLRKFSRFLYLPWPRGHVEQRSHSSEWQASHKGYAQLGVTWVRRVRRGATGGWEIEDRVRCDRSRRLRWHWRMAGEGWRLANGAIEHVGLSGGERLEWTTMPIANATLVRADTSSATGWWSPRYARVEPADALVLDVVVPPGETIMSFRVISLSLPS